jgi:hypothetical protein
MITVFLSARDFIRGFGPGDYLLRAPMNRVGRRCFTSAASGEDDNNAQRCAACEAECEIKVIDS